MKVRSTLCKFAVLFATLITTTTTLFASPAVGMKILVIAMNDSDPSYQAITTTLDQIGVPYDSVIVSTLTRDASGNLLSSFPLSDSTTGNGLYQGIIQTDGSFSVCATPTTCASLLSASDWSKLTTYESTFAVRVAVYYTAPDPQWGLTAADTGANYSSSNPLSLTITPAGTAIFSYLNPANPIPVSGASGGDIWAYRATPTAASGETTTPLLTSGAYTFGATHVTADGRETMALTVNNAPGLLHTEAFGYGVINWVTRGVFIGSRRVYLNPQIDDMLLGNRLYAPTLPQCPNDESCPTLYASGQDIQTLLNWQNNLKADPLFSTFHNTYALNGVGTTWFDPSDPVFAAIASLGSNFTWLSHTWDHANLDCYSTDSTGACVPATLEQSLAELNQNIAVAPSLGITLDLTSMVTPFDSGLTNQNFLTAAVQVGIQNLMSSAPPQDPQVGVVSTANPAIYLIPRIGPNLFDDVSVPQTGVSGSWVDEYNATFGPSGTQPTFSQNLTYSQILDYESDLILLGQMLAYDPVLLGFHIDNASTYDGTHSLYSDLMDAAIAKYKNVFTLPVITMDMKDLVPIFKSRASIKTSGVSGVYTPGVSVVLTATNAGAIPVTGACSQASCGTYGGQIQDTVTMAANSTLTLSLASPAGVSLSSLAINPTSVTGGAAVTGTITLSGAAPSGGAPISLVSNNAVATVPVSVTVAAGNNSATFAVNTSSVTSSTSATITASYSGVSQIATVAIDQVPSALSSFALNTSSVVGGTSVTATITLSGAAPSGGSTVSISSNNAAATVPASVMIPAGTTTGTFTVTTSPVTSATSASLTASYNSVTQTAPLSITLLQGSLVAMKFVPVTPCRAVDTRNATSPLGGPSLNGQETRKFVLTNVCGLPSEALAYSLNVTAVPHGPLSYLSIWPDGASQPLVSTLNSYDGRVKANAVLVENTAGAVDVFVTNASDVILDVNGYFVANTSTTAGLAFFPLAPCRIVDTRDALSPLGGPSLAANQARDFAVQQSSCNIPATAQAYSLNVTAIPQAGNVGYLSIWPSGQAQPLVSTLNVANFAVTANAALIKAGTNGNVTVFSTDDADVILDINGYFAPQSGTGLSFYPVSPCRQLDTRENNELSATRDIAISANSCAPLPAGVKAFALNATVVPTGALHFVSFWPDDEAQPNVSTLNAYDGAVTSNLAIVTTNTGGIDAFASEPTNLILDLAGAFAP